MNRKISLLFFVVFSTSAWAGVIVTVGGRPITEDLLEKTLQSSPFATQFPTLDADEQASLRGDLLQRLIHFQALGLEAERLKLDQTPEFKAEIKSFEAGLLAQRYLQQLREQITIPNDQEQRWRDTLGMDLDALSAARAVYISRQYKARKEDKLNELKRRFGDLSETQLLAKGALEAGIKVNEQVNGFRRELLVSSLLKHKEKEWIPDESVLRDYYQRHPEIGKIPERRRIGQIVVADRKLAEMLRHKILAGESLFKLAKEFSIDPYGRKNAGDMGWMKEGSGMPAIEKALATLPDNTVSEVIQTPRGFHLLIITDRKPGQQKAFSAIKDRVKRAFLAEKMPAFLEQVLSRYPVQWHSARKGDVKNLAQ
ncbi:MAG: hypothetical protein AXA67_13280 [Methylothermaceae bacteria B42]|nr:MAG: hypothetical protein AXA67_13280 [Methylothermaceae bacteria B42]HHJ38404.1 peptidyl-prolyl cis-trans isomerase [Methylothermaceae bacterium]